MTQYNKEQPGRSAQSALPSDAEIRQIIEGNDLDAAKKLVQVSEKLGRELANGSKLNTTQIRGIFGTVRLIEMNWSADAADTSAAARSLLLLKPKLAYQAARKPEVKPLADVLTKAIDAVGSDRTRFKRFVEFFEAVLAYHRASGGK